MRSGDGQRKSGPGSVGLYRLISGTAFAAMVLVRRWSPLAHSTNQNPEPGLDRLKETRRELQSTDWFVSCGPRHPASSEWPFPLDEGGALTTSATELGGLGEDSISGVSAPVI